MKNLLKLRVLSAVIGIPLILLLVWLGSWSLLIFTGLVMLLGSIELMVMFKKIKIRVPVGITLLLVLGTLLVGGLGNIESRLFFLLASLIFIMIMLVIFYPKYSLFDGMAILFIVLYMGLLVHIYLIRELTQGLMWLLFVLICIWASDTLAYFVGKKFGTRKLIPLVSPGKTIEGSVGGLAGCILVAGIFALIYPEISFGFFVFLAFLVGIFAQLGDLWESLIKRRVGVKDSSKLIPGHGGILDRFDSMFFTMPVIYYCLLFIPN